MTRNALPTEPAPRRPVPANLVAAWVIVTLTSFPAPAAAAEIDPDAAVRLGFGYDSNPLRISRDGPGGGFVDLAVDAGVSVRPGGRDVRVFFEAAGLERRHEPGLDGADLTRADARLGIALPSVFVGGTRLSLAAGAMWEARRSTFTDRLTGEIYDVPSDPPTVPATEVAIPDRFDSDTTGGFLEMNWRLARRLRLFLISSMEHTGYARDYSGATALEPLDFDAWSVESGVLYQVNGAVVLEGSAVLTDIDFDAQPALDRNGDPVGDETREYRYAQYRLRVRIWPARNWTLTAGLHGGGREDTFAGYYSYDGWTGFVTADRRIGERSRIRWLVSSRHQDYARATVAGDPDGEFRGQDVRRAVGRFDRTLRRHVGVFVEGGIEKTDSRDALFSYDRDWALTGIEFRL